ncbi:hypothetical protein FSO04_06320 [Paraburkholderia madseniana]|uniref:Type I restriction endonuclease subunit M n=1 Tax=Paraburkholderia madseniana TaxID=2599607 RepID=A0A6N6WJG8_9BURK|nr:hypothetical protein [Paraburkholderia madseniana]KAE8760837.1 hypothetical protein FSO04_06320 [Paraburkholderia madseniana]
MNPLSARPTPRPLTVGRLFATHGALEAVRAANASVGDLLTRHLHGDWGDLRAEDRRQNDVALENGLRVLSCYELPGNGKVWIITEWNRSVTTVLLPDDY